MDTEFFAMGGYAFYVWTSYGLSAVVLIANAIGPRMREKSLLKKIVQRTGDE